MQAMTSVGFKGTGDAGFVMGGSVIGSAVGVWAAVSFIASAHAGFVRVVLPQRFYRDITGKAPVMRLCNFMEAVRQGKGSRAKPFLIKSILQVLLPFTPV
jgi:hypothetical protein